jgi:hypothetical protein
MCPRTTMCPHTSTYVSICMSLQHQWCRPLPLPQHLCPHTAMCFHTTIYVCLYDSKGRGRGGKCIALVLAPPHIHTYIDTYICMHVYGGTTGALLCV